DSLRRQTDGRTEDFCTRHGLALDTTLTLCDRGVSAFRGEHHSSDLYALGKFLDLAKRGRIAHGSHLIVQDLHRPTPPDEGKALRLWMALLDLGINIATLEPEQIFRHDNHDILDIMRALIELSRAHQESKRKSFLLSQAWQAKKQCVRDRQPQPARRDSAVA